MKTFVRILVPLLLALLLVSPSIAQGDTFRVTASQINVRSGPGIEYDVIGYVLGGTSYSIVAYSPTGNWIKLNFTNTQGWVFRHLGLVQSSSNISIVNPPASVPASNSNMTVPIPSVDMVSGFNADYFYSTVGVSAALNVRNGAGLGYRILTIIPYGKRATPLARSADGTWILVNYNGVTGWVYFSYVVPPPGMVLAALPVQ
jgi:uncharacterized protein YraI